MSGASGIEWTDATWNPVTGCTKVSPGCANCYAEVVADRFWATQYRPVIVGDGASIDTVSTSHHEYLLANGLARPRRFTDVQAHRDRLTQPLSWRKPRKVFVNSMSDLFHEAVPDAFIDQVFAVMALAPRHTFQVLTKRAERMGAYFGAQPEARMADAAVSIGVEFPLDDVAKRERRSGVDDDTFEQGNYYRACDRLKNLTWPLPNVWLGVSVENQHFLERIDRLKDTPAAVRFVSFEPLLEDLGALLLDGIDWCIPGGESGPYARPCHVEWIESILSQGRAAGVAVFVKQLGAVPLVRANRRRHDEFGEGNFDYWNDERSGLWRVELKDRKGGDMAEWPEDLRVREFPTVLPRSGMTS